jgi:hypothetical protein
MSLAVDVVKSDSKRGSEWFLRDKLHASIVATCLSVRTPSGQAEAIAHAVCDNVEKWLQERPEITSQDLRTVAAKHLQTFHPDAAYMYEQYLVMI